MKSLKELFRTGRGPSSSHTMGPCRAAEQILQEFPDAADYEVTLYGSLAATGKGHFTDQAILQVLGPERTSILWEPEIVLPQHPNGMRFRITPRGSGPVTERTLFSIGGGAISADGTAESTPDVYPFRDMRDIMEHCLKESTPLWMLAELCGGTTKMFCNQNIVKNCLALPETNILKSTCNSKLCDFIWSWFQMTVEYSLVISRIEFFHFSTRMIFYNLISVEPDSTICWRIYTGNNIECSCLTCSVRTDKRNNFSLINFKRKIINGNYTAELHCYIFHFQNVHFLFLIFLKNPEIPEIENSLSPIIPFW